jgi:hypothetical protein
MFFRRLRRRILSVSAAAESARWGIGRVQLVAGCMKSRKHAGIDVPPHFLTLPASATGFFLNFSAASAVSLILHFLRRLLFTAVPELNVSTRTFFCPCCSLIWIRRRSCDYRGIYVDQENE